MADAEYHRAWRAAHPEYRARQNALRNERRRLKGRGDRSAEYAKRPSRAQSVHPIPDLHTGHPLFDAARAVVGPRTSAYHTLYDPLYDDLISVATLALLRGEDPRAAVSDYRRRELYWGRVTAPIEWELSA